MQFAPYQAMATSPLLLQTSIVNIAAGITGSGEATDTTDDHYRRAKQHASASADRAGDAFDEASTSAARRYYITSIQITCTVMVMH